MEAQAWKFVVRLKSDGKAVMHTECIDESGARLITGSAVVTRENVRKVFEDQQENAQQLNMLRQVRSLARKAAVGAAQPGE